MLSPIKVFIIYKKNNPTTLGAPQESNQIIKNDLKVFFSYSNPKPDQQNCDGMFKDNPLCITINAPNSEK